MTATVRLPVNWRDRLPCADAYYRERIPKLTKSNAQGWAQGVCPFHDDRTASISVNVADSGGWRCFAGCGSGDLVSFHSRITGKSFKEAVAELLRLRA